MSNLTPAVLQAQLTKYFDGDIERVKSMVRGCNLIGFKMSDHLENIAEHQEVFMTLISYAEFGIFDKLEDTLKILKKERT